MRLLSPLTEHNNTTSQQVTQAQADQNQAVSAAQSKVTELEAALAEKLKANEELAQHINTKDEEIARLSEIIEHGDLRPHKLKKPRNSIPITPPATLSHSRSNSIGARFGFDRERQRTVSTGSHKVHAHTGSAIDSPTVSPAYRAQTLPPAEPYSVTAAGTVSGSVAGHGEDASGAADTSMASSTGSAGLAPPSLGKSSRKKSVSTRKRLSSILGIHIGDKDKDKAEKDKDKDKDQGMTILPHA
jgi:hypothetical protein